MQEFLFLNKRNKPISNTKIVSNNEWNFTGKPMTEVVEEQVNSSSSPAKPGIVNGADEPRPEAGKEPEPIVETKEESKETDMGLLNTGGKEGLT